MREPNITQEKVPAWLEKTPKSPSKKYHPLGWLRAKDTPVQNPPPRAEDGTCRAAGTGSDRYVSDPPAEFSTPRIREPSAVRGYGKQTCTEQTQEMRQSLQMTVPAVNILLPCIKCMRILENLHSDQRTSHSCWALPVRSTSSFMLRVEFF